MEDSDFGFPIHGTEYWIIRARPHARASQGEGLVPHWFVAHPRDPDDHLFMLSEVTDLESPYPPSYLEARARQWIAENAEHLRQARPASPPGRPSRGG